MAFLPNLDTASIGPIAFWNFLDHSSDDSLNPAEVLDYADIVTWSEYDNGVEGTLENAEVGRDDINYRVKADGWIMVWLDRTNSYTVSSGDKSNPNGYWDMAWNWADYSSNINMVPITTLSYEIDQLRQRLSNAGSATFNHSDTGLYNYEYPNANTIITASEDGDASMGETTLNGGISYNSYTTRYYHAVAASAYSEDGSATAEGSFNGAILASIAGGEEYGAVDVLGDNLMPDAQTVYSNDGTLQGGDEFNTQVNMSHVIWAEV